MLGSIDTKRNRTNQFLDPGKGDAAIADANGAESGRSDAAVPDAIRLLRRQSN